jgi:predicted N-acyltransferase
VTPAFSARLHRSIVEIPRESWDSCFPGDPESWAYYRAVEIGGLTAFSWLYLSIAECGRIICVVPAFTTDYRLDTTMQGRWKYILEPIVNRFTRLFTLRLACLGSPFADKCHLGFTPDILSDRQPEIVRLLLAELDRFAAASGIGLIAIKDLMDSEVDGRLAPTLRASGFSRQPSLPTAILHLQGKSEEGYFETLTRSTRKDVRRKMKGAALIRVEQRRGDGALGIVPEISRLHEAHRQRSAVDFGQFERLTPAYFNAVFSTLGDAAIVFLYWIGERLAGFNLAFESDRVLIDKFIGFETVGGQEPSLYVASWMNNVRYCIDRRIPALQTGQTGYAMKKRLGSTLLQSSLFFRHRTPVLNFILRLLGPLLAADRYDESLS